MIPKKLEQKVDEYARQPHTIVLYPEEIPGEGVGIEILEFKGCISSGDTFEEALQHIFEAKKQWIRLTLKNGNTIPAPIETSGEKKILLRMPGSYYYKILKEAKADGVSLNQKINLIIAEHIGEIKHSISSYNMDENPHENITYTFIGFTGGSECQEKVLKKYQNQVPSNILKCQKQLAG